MKITAIESLTKHKMRVFLDGEPAFVFSDREMREWRLYEGLELDGDRYRQLMQYTERMAARAAMDLLIRRDYSEAELRQKLIGKGFSDETAARGIDYVQGYHYLDDERYARHLIEVKKGTVSRQMMVYQLRQKGIADATIQLVMEAAGWDDLDGLRHEMRKRFRKDTELSELSEKEKQKLCQSLLRKGYHYADIRRAFADEYGQIS